MLIDGVVVGHQVCVWKNSKEFCLANKYWAGEMDTTDENAGMQTKIKLRRDIQEALGVTIQDSNCSYSQYTCNCDFDIFRCGTGYDGNSGCNGISKYCYVFGNGSAKCDVL